MWELKNQTPYASERCFVRDQDGAEVWVVAVKASFAFRADGTTEVSDEQEEVFPAPRHRGDPARSSLLHESDLVLKPTTDVLLQGSAHAPGRKPATHLDVGLRVGPVTKVLRVFGERFWRGRLGWLSLSEPEPFVSMEITYERAFGGASPGANEQAAWDVRNPAGVGYAVAAEHLINQRAPNVEEPRWLISSWKHRPPPAGFGPIARAWSPRRELAGTYDQAWEQTRAPLLPADFDPRFYQCAPADQQSAVPLRGGEPVTLLNLHPELAQVHFSLPKVWLTFQTRLGRDVIEHRSQLSTVILQPEIEQVRMVWCTALPCQGREHELEMTVIREKKFV